MSDAPLQRFSVVWQHARCGAHIRITVEARPRAIRPQECFPEQGGCGQKRGPWEYLTHTVIWAEEALNSAQSNIDRRE